MIIWCLFLGHLGSWGSLGSHLIGVERGFINFSWVFQWFFQYARITCIGYLPVACVSLLGGHSGLAWGHLEDTWGQLGVIWRTLAGSFGVTYGCHVGSVGGHWCSHGCHLKVTWSQLGVWKAAFKRFPLFFNGFVVRGSLRRTVSHSNGGASGRVGKGSPSLWD